jgi:hypothetical protein
VAVERRFERRDFRGERYALVGSRTRLVSGIDILHELGNRALSRSKNVADVRTLQTFDHREPLLRLFYDASATGSTVQCQREQDIVDPPSIIKLFQEHPSDIPLVDTVEVIRRSASHTANPGSIHR